MAQVALRGVTHRYPGMPKPALADVDLVIADGESLAVVGPSGSGKSTLLRLIAGVERPSQGAILIGGQPVTDLAPGQRSVATVGRSYPLYARMTVAQNIAFPLVNAGTPAAVTEARLRVLSANLSLQPLLDRHPGELSAADRLTVCLARAIARPVHVLLLDDPLAGLDHDDRRRARDLLGRVHRAGGTTTITVCVDQSEAMTLGDRIAVFADGRLLQASTPMDLYRHPGSLAVARQFGDPPMNTLVAAVDGPAARVGELTIPLPARLAEQGLRTVVVGAHPEDFHALPHGAPATVQHVELTGSQALVHVRLDSAAGPQEITVRESARAAPRRGEVVQIDLLRDDDVVFFDPVTGTSL